MAVHKANPNANVFVRFMRKIYNPIGFKKGYNFILFFIFAGALFGFLMARLPYLSINGYYKTAAAPGEWFWYSKRFYNIGIAIHLCCIIPAALLALLQFIPVIRYKLTIFHRINGYFAITLLLIGNVGALMIARHAFGGTVATQAGVGTLALATTTSAFLAYYNIKVLQIDQHRAWMLRCWFYAGSIITLRLIMILAALIVSQRAGYYIAMPCEQIAFTGGEKVADSYPACHADASGYTAVQANMLTPKSVVEVAAALQVNFGMALWLALALHAIGIELYLRLTPAESERLKRVSYQRQLERGFKHAGSAGLTVDRLGDAEEWKPPIGDAKPADTASLAESKLSLSMLSEEDLNASTCEISRPATALSRERQIV